jgi:hypothetical protein
MMLCLIAALAALAGFVSADFPDCVNGPVSRVSSRSGSMTDKLCVSLRIIPYVIQLRTPIREQQL